jgi:hypothetical protein
MCLEKLNAETAILPEVMTSGRMLSCSIRQYVLLPCVTSRAISYHSIKPRRSAAVSSL